MQTLLTMMFFPHWDWHWINTNHTDHNGYGKMNKGRIQVVIRFRSFNEDCNSYNWFQTDAILSLVHWKHSLLGGYSNYEEHYNHVKHIFVANEQKYTLAGIEGLEIGEENIPEHAWNQIALILCHTAITMLILFHTAITMLILCHCHHNADTLMHYLHNADTLPHCHHNADTFPHCHHNADTLPLPSQCWYFATLPSQGSVEKYQHC